MTALYVPDPKRHRGPPRWKVRPEDLVRPPSVSKRAAWPPPLEVAYKAFAEAPSIYGGPSRHPRRYRRAAWDYAAALAVGGTESGLVEAYWLFLAIAGGRADVAAGGAVANAGMVLSRFPARTALALSTAALERVRDDFVAALTKEVSAALQGLRQAPESLAWANRGRTRLRAPTKAGRARLAALPARPMEGTWRGVSAALLNYGLRPPERPALPDPIRVVADAKGLSVAPMS